MRKPRKRKMTMENPTIRFIAMLVFGGSSSNNPQAGSAKINFWEGRKSLAKKKRPSQILGSLSMYVFIKVGFPWYFVDHFLLYLHMMRIKNSSYILQASTSFSQKKIEAVFEDVLCFSAGTKPRWLRVKKLNRIFLLAKKKDVVPPGWPENKCPERYKRYKIII